MPGGCMAGRPEYDAVNRGDRPGVDLTQDVYQSPGGDGRCKDGTPAGGCKKGCFMRRGGGLDVTQ